MAEAAADVGFFKMPHKTTYDARLGRALDPALAGHGFQVCCTVYGLDMAKGGHAVAWPA